MNNASKKEEARRFSTLDVFIVLLLVLCIAGLVIRLTVGRDGVLPKEAPKQAEYAVSFRIEGQRSSVGEEVSSGAILYTEDGAVFGTVASQDSTTPAEIFVVDKDGTVVSEYSKTEGDSSRWDIEGTVALEGYPVDYGFLVGGKTYIAPNYTLTLRTDTVTFPVRIMGITKIG